MLELEIQNIFGLCTFSSSQTVISIDFQSVNEICGKTWWYLVARNWYASSFPHGSLSWSGLNAIQWVTIWKETFSIRASAKGRLFVVTDYNFNIVKYKETFSVGLHGRILLMQRRGLFSSIVIRSAEFWIMQSYKYYGVSFVINLDCCTLLYRENCEH